MASKETMKLPEVHFVIHSMICLLIILVYSIFVLLVSVLM